MTSWQGAACLMCAGLILGGTTGALPATASSHGSPVAEAPTGGAGRTFSVVGWGEAAAANAVPARLEHIRIAQLAAGRAHILR